jgi:hypothetical protein
VYDFAENFIVDAAFVAEAHGGFSLQAEELAEDLAVAGKLLVGHAAIVGALVT